MNKEEITHNGRRLAILIYKEAQSLRGNEFYTEDQDRLQVGKHHHLKGDVIQPHRHLSVHIDYDGPLQEMLYIEQGKMKVFFFSAEGEFVDFKIVGTGDIILIQSGGHGFEFFEETKMLEVKQGPYIPDSKKKLEQKL